MRVQSLILSVVLLTAGTTPVFADVDWGGPGYYIEDDVNMFFGGFVAGPFSTQADCNNAMAALSKNDAENPVCTYYSSDPDQD